MIDKLTVTIATRCDGAEYVELKTPYATVIHAATHIEIIDSRDRKGDST